MGCGLVIETCSLLPAGSGMGGSSILAATVLQSLASTLAFPLSNDTLVYLVGQVEQVMGTGGGWQDQVSN